MKKFVLPLILLFVIAVISFSFVTGPPTGVTNAPGETSCYTNGLCHVGTPDVGPGFAEITVMGGIPVGGYVPGTTYTIMPFVIDTTKVKYGFEVVSLTQSNGTGTGSAVVLDPVKTQKVSVGTKDYVMHTQTGTVVSGIHDWMYEWTAPAAGTGTVIFYGAFNAANGNGTTSGDQIYTDTLMLPENVNAGIEENDLSTVQLFPNPATEYTNLILPKNLSSKTTLKIYNLEGRLFLNEVVSSTNMIKIEVSDFPSQTYIVILQNANSISTYKKLVVPR